MAGRAEGKWQQVSLALCYSIVSILDQWATQLRQVNSDRRSWLLLEHITRDLFGDKLVR